MESNTGSSQQSKVGARKHILPGKAMSFMRFILICGATTLVLLMSFRLLSLSPDVVQVDTSVVADFENGQREFSIRISNGSVRSFTVTGFSANCGCVSSVVFPLTVGPWRSLDIPFTVDGGGGESIAVGFFTNPPIARLSTIVTIPDGQPQSLFPTSDPFFTEKE